MPRRTYSAPTPFGPWNLWAESDSMSIFMAFTSMGTWPTACTASVWKNTPFSLHTLPISAMGIMVPTSLFANITDTSTVLSLMAFFTCSAVTMPFSSTGR